MEKKYKNISGQDLCMVGIGLVKDGEIISGEINSPFFEEVKTGPKQDKQSKEPKE